MMKLLINNAKDILSDKLSVTQRGLLITALLVKENNPTLTWAKFKALIPIKNHREDLIYLHENGFIRWDNYKVVKKQIELDRDTSREEGIIEFMNNLYGRKFGVKSKHNISLVRNRLLDYKEEDIKLVISNRYLEWKDDEVMKIHLNPTTVLRASKFEKYLEEASHTRVGEGIVAVKQIDLKKGDVVGMEHIDSLAPKHPYKIKIYQDDIYLNTKIVYGKDLRQLIRKSTRPGQEKLIYKYSGE